MANKMRARGNSRGFLSYCVNTGFQPAFCMAVRVHTLQNCLLAESPLLHTGSWRKPATAAALEVVPYSANDRVPFKTKFHQSPAVSKAALKQIVHPFADTAGEPSAVLESIVEACIQGWSIEIPRLHGSDKMDDLWSSLWPDFPQTCIAVSLEIPLRI